jgi:hypothetical protein
VRDNIEIENQGSKLPLIDESNAKKDFIYLMQTVSDWKRLKTNKSYATKKSFTISASDEPGF